MDPRPFGLEDDGDDALLAAQFRRSVDDHDDAVATTTTMSAPLGLTLPALDAADAALWNLISPCSDVSEPPLDDLALDDDDHEEPEQERGEVEPEASPRREAIGAFDSAKQTLVEQRMAPEEDGPDDDDDARVASSSDSEDEEVEVFNADTAFVSSFGDANRTLDHRRRSSSSVGSLRSKDDALDSVTEADECFDELDVLSSSASSSQWLVDDSASEDGGAATGNSSTASSTATRTGRWVGRVKARTYSGPASLQLHNAYGKLRARTLSATATLRHAASTGASSATSSHGGDDDDDGGFSSDDEDYDHDRASRGPTPTARATSLSFPTRLSAVKNLQGLQLPTKVASIMRFRSSSSTTTSSEDSFIGSHGSFQDSTLGPDLASDAVSTPATPTPSGLAANRHELLKHKATACATRAAGLLGAASAEAARKLRTARAFRAASTPSMSRAATSPVVDRHEGSSPGRPPRPTRAAATTRSSS